MSTTSRYACVELEADHSERLRTALRHTSGHRPCSECSALKWKAKGKERVWAYGRRINFDGRKLKDFEQMRDAGIEHGDEVDCFLDFGGCLAGMADLRPDGAFRIEAGVA